VTDETEVEFEADDTPEDMMHGPDGSLDCIEGRWAFVAFWLAKLGIESPEGAALTFGEGCSLSILHPHTGKWMTPEDIAKAAAKSAQVTRIQ
jgi:hypothetical protein